MNPVFVDSADAVTLVGGAPVARAQLQLAMARAPVVVAADGGADRCLAMGVMPHAAIGDFDSISLAARATLGPDRCHVIAEQETTDFDKVLRSVRAPFTLALGFAGARIDHGLAALSALVRHAGPPCLLVGPRDVVFAAPPRLSLSLRVGDRVSLFPMAPVSGESTGLEWPIDGLLLEPAGRIGTSNRASAAQVQLHLSGPGMLVILPRARLDAAIRALVPAWRAPAAVRGGSHKAPIPR